MTQTKQQYLQFVRANSAYPVYRGFIGTIALLGYMFAAVIGLVAVIGAIMLMKTSFLLGFVVLVGGGIYTALTALLVRLAKEAALILVDMGDSIVESNAAVRGAPVEPRAAATSAG